MADQNRQAQQLKLQSPPESFKQDQREWLSRLIERFERTVRDAIAPVLRGQTPAAVFVLKGKTTNNTATEIFINGNSTMPARMTVPTDTSWAYHGRVVARRTDADNETAHYEFVGTIDNNAGTVALAGSTTVTVVHEDTAAWTIAVDASNGALRVRVTGENSKTIAWIAYVEVVPVTG